MEKKNGIVLAMFGTTSETALPGLLAVFSQVCEAFPLAAVRLAFTSNIIRSIWRRRGLDPAYRQAHPNIPEALYTVQGQLAAIANLQDEGCRSIVVQAVHIAPAEEFHDLCRYVRALGSIRTMKPRWTPFQHLVIGRPVLGTFHPDYPYARDILLAAEALKEDTLLTNDSQTALVYMGHGNSLFPSGGFYMELAAAMNRLYPNIDIFIGTIEGYPTLDDILPELRRHEVKRVVLKPLLLAAGAHAQRDMAGDMPDSWKNRIEQEGFEVTVVLRGLGEQTAFSSLFIRHILDAAEDAGMELR